MAIDFVLFVFFMAIFGGAFYEKPCLQVNESLLFYGYGLRPFRLAYIS